MEGERLRAKGEKISFDTEDGIKEFEIKPMKNRQLSEVLELIDKKQGFKASMLMAKYSLNNGHTIKNGIEKSFSDADLDEMDTPFLLQILKVSSKINGLEDIFDFQARGMQGQTNPNILQPESRKDIFDENLERLNQNPSKKIS